ncbi:hypothetical protein MXD62_19990 [Frankia sp. Mgl5]|uniref:hypothetical protein n=1 Tax=Frankia sp. Mgl5 TaxID=2933793 RepID=UPI00201055CA|nr:hypothetical protein [Frankia sp. Mgl5]MCK9929432.1 hypothetical protein [Frankia sp. Mgl5]
MSWEQLADILREARQLAQEDASAPPTACPDDGIPLEASHDGGLHCRFCGWRPGGRYIGDALGGL